MAHIGFQELLHVCCKMHHLHLEKDSTEMEKLTDSGMQVGQMQNPTTSSQIEGTNGELQIYGMEHLEATMKIQGYVKQWLIRHAFSTNDHIDRRNVIALSFGQEGKRDTEMLFRESSMQLIKELHLSKKRKEDKLVSSAQEIKMFQKEFTAAHGRKPKLKDFPEDLIQMKENLYYIEVEINEIEDKLKNVNGKLGAELGVVSRGSSFSEV